MSRCLCLIRRDLHYRRLAFEAGLSWPEARLYAARGPNGADLALLRAARTEADLEIVPGIAVADGFHASVSRKVSSALAANARMLAWRSALPVLRVKVFCAGPATAMQEWPAGSP